MPIIDLQRRLREIGRIRIGQQQPTSNGRKRPAKLDRFRFTSRDQAIIAEAAARWGGEVAPWESPDGRQWEVVTQADDLDVIVPPAEMAWSQWYELWSGGGCQRRCDGQTDHITDKPCLCDPEQRDCKITTRLSVMLPDLPGLGIWRLESHGYYAAVELGGVVEIAQAAAARGQMLPARLRLEQRSVKRDGKTNRFVVPALDLGIQPAALLAGGSVTAVEIGSPSVAPTFTPVAAGELPAAPDLGSVAEQVASVESPPPPRRRANSAAPLPPTGLDPRPAAAAVVVEAPPTPAPPAITSRDLGILATKAFPCDDSEKGRKTKDRDRLRHALAYAVTSGRAWHFADLTTEEVTRLSARLGDVIEGRCTYVVDEIGVTFTAGGKSPRVDWVQLEPEAVA